LITRLSTKGQLIIPKEIRDRHGWQPGTELQVVDRDDHLVVRLAAEVRATSLDDLIGCTGYSGPRRSLEDMEAAIALGAGKHR